MLGPSVNKADLTADIAVLLADALEPLHESVCALHAMLEGHMPAVEACCCVGEPRGIPKGAVLVPRQRPPSEAGRAAASDQVPARSAGGVEAAGVLSLLQEDGAPEGRGAEPGPARLQKAGSARPRVAAGAAPAPAGAGDRGEEEGAAGAVFQSEATSRWGAAATPSRSCTSGSLNTVDFLDVSALRTAVSRETRRPSATMRETGLSTVVGRTVATRHASGVLKGKEGTIIPLMLACAKWWEGLQEPPREGCFAQAVTSQWFRSAVNMIILLNFVYVTYMANYDMQHVGQLPPRVFTLLEWTMLGCFSVELLLRLIVHRMYFFFNSEMGWNIFDFVVVTVSISDLILDVAVGRVHKVTFVRTVRFLRMAKLLRALRILKVFRALAHLMESLARSATSLFWCLVMLAFLLYLFALVCMTGVSGYLAGGAAMLDEQDIEKYMFRFGSLPRAWFTLFGSISGGIEWVEIYYLLAPAGVFYSVAFMGFIIFFMFALFNILTGIIVEQASAVAAPARGQQVLELRRAKLEEAEELKRVCDLMDVDKSGTMSWDELKKGMENPTVAAYLASVGLEVHDVELFFHTIAGSSELEDLDIHMFVEACMTMKGQATALDMRQQLFYTAALSKRVKKFEASCNEKMELLVGISERLLACLERG